MISLLAFIVGYATCWAISNKDKVQKAIAAIKEKEEKKES